MATGVTTYQCPACTAPLHFVGESGKLECDYCGATYEIEEIEKLVAEKEQEAAQVQAEHDAANAQHAAETETTGVQWDQNEIDGLKVYNCPSCGAELICEQSTAAMSCPYCGNPTILPGQFAGGLRPDLVIPFKLDKQAAQNALKEFYKGKKLLPKTFISQNHIEEIKGVYVPFWLYDCRVEGTAEFIATRSRIWREGNYQITETDHFQVIRGGSIHFEKIPADASSKMPDEYMDAIEPFDYSELKTFSTAYLPGYLADKYDVDVDQAAPRIEERAKNSAEAALRDTVRGYEIVTKEKDNYHVHRNTPKYALMPVWLLSTRWNGENFLFAMNGQTGKMVGDLPVDKRRYWAWFAGIALPLMAIMLGFWLF